MREAKPKILGRWDFLVVKRNRGGKKSIKRLMSATLPYHPKLFFDLQRILYTLLFADILSQDDKLGFVSPLTLQLVLLDSDIRRRCIFLLKLLLQ